jgi:hypothetical protein
MYNGWLEYAGIEIINAARTRKYVESFLPELSVTCETAGLLSARGHTSYVSPAADNAPWYRSARPATGRFYGLFPGVISGAEDSTRGVTVIELSGDGATHAKPRYGSHEIKITGLALAADEEAMAEGLAWLRDALATGECGDTGGCVDNDLRLYTARPANGLSDNHMLRTFLRVEVLDNLKVTKEFPSRRAVAKQVSFIFSAGTPWAFTPKVMVGNVTPTSGTSVTDAAGEDCYTVNNAYADFVNDPYYTAIAKPPQPPVVKPPNVANVTSWRRKTLAVTQSEVDRWGRVTPIVTVSTGAGGAAMLRVRFYGGATVTGCGFEGEFLISYIPPNATMVIDAMRKDIKVLLANGRTVPGGHLVYGSQGLPMKWPALGCKTSYTMVADILAGQSGITVYLESAVRE